MREYKQRMLKPIHKILTEDFFRDPYEEFAEDAQPMLKPTLIDLDLDLSANANAEK